MSEISSPKDDPFRFIVASVDEALDKCIGKPDADVRQLPNFGSVTLSRNRNEGTHTIENFLPVDDDGFHRVFTFTFGGEQPQLTMGIKHHTRLDEETQVIGQTPVTPGSYWENAAHEVLKKYLQAEK